MKRATPLLSVIEFLTKMNVTQIQVFFHMAQNTEVQKIPNHLECDA